MAFENYKLGVATAVAPVIPFPADLYESGVRAGKVLALARRVPGVMGYYKVGIGGLGILQMGPGELFSEIQLLNAEIKGVGEELEIAREASGALTGTPLSNFLRGPWSEFIGAWNTYKLNHDSWMERVLADPNQLKRFRLKFAALYGVAKGILGSEMKSPEPSADPKGFFEKPSNLASSLFGFLKTLSFFTMGLIGVLAIGALILFFRR